MSRTFRRGLLILVFVFIAAQTHLSQAQPAKPATPDLQPREILNQSHSQIDLPPADGTPQPGRPEENTPEKDTPTTDAPRSPGALILNDGFEGA